MMACVDPFVPADSRKLDEVLRLNAARTPDGEALVYAREPQLGRVCRWSELDGLADAFAQLLLDRGTAVGDRIAVILTDAPECIAAVYGILRRVAHTIGVGRKESGLVFGATGISDGARRH